MTVTDKQKELTDLLEKDAALHARIAAAASALTAKAVREALVAALGEPPQPKPKGDA